MLNIRPLYRSVAALAFAVALPLATLAQSKEPVKVGLVTSKSGVFADLGEEVLRASQFAIDEANAKGGVDGRKVQVRIVDDESIPEVGRRSAEKVARDGYNLVTGNVGSSMVLAVMQSVDRWDGLYVAAFGRGDAITGESCKRRAFHTVQSGSLDFATIKEWSKSFKEKSFGVLAADYVWGQDSAAFFKKTVEANGRQVPLTLLTPVGTKDYSPYIAQLKAANVEAIWVALSGRDAINFTKQAQEFGLFKGKKMYGHSVLQDFIVNATGDALKGTEGTIGYAPDIDTPRNKAFVTAWKAKFNRFPTDNEAYAYTGIQVLFDGVKKAGSIKPADIAKALSGAQLDTIYGPATIRPQDHQLLLPNFVGSVKVVDGVLRPVIEKRFDASLTPPPSPLCKM